MKTEKSFTEIVNEQLAADETRLPVFNETALRVHQELGRDDPDTGLIENIIVRDQALTGQILRQANSAFFRGLQKVSTVKEAIIRLGIREVARIVMVVSQKELFVSNDRFINTIMTTLFRHSQATAMGSQWLARQCRFEALENEAFFAGLLHDVGKLFILTVIERIRSKNLIDFDPTQALLNEVLETLHPEQGYSLMKSWNLPEKYCDVARDHHQEDFDQNNFLLAIVRLANKAANKIGVGLIDSSSLILSATAEANLLGLSDIDLARLEIELEDALEKYA
ncbi:MAG: HDOD domain-containing protein [Thermodesulfobacteriota bacterium]